MIRIDRNFRDRLVKWTIILSIILEIVMVVINIPDIKEIVTYCGMGLVIIFFVIFSEIRGLAFCLRYGLIQYSDSAAEEQQKDMESVDDILSNRLETIQNQNKQEDSSNKSE